MLAKPKGAGWECDVLVEHDGGRTEHAVTVSTASLARWAPAATQEGVADLVRRSFEFLLEREPLNSILPRFDLSVIETYFPEYDELIRERQR